MRFEKILIFNYKNLRKHFLDPQLYLVVRLDLGAVDAHLLLQYAHLVHTLYIEDGGFHEAAVVLLTQSGPELKFRLDSVELAGATN